MDKSKILGIVNMNDFSVLLSVYHKEKPDYLRQALDSVFSQTLRAAQVVLVEDGPLTPDLDTVIANYSGLYSELEVIPLEKNLGLGGALNEGLNHCNFDLVARMDTDDISKPERFEKQVNYMLAHPEIDVVSSWIDEFIETPDDVRSVRRLPQTSEELYEFGKKRNPINHPVVMFRKSAVLKAGSYQHFPLFEDYYLWVPMMLAGSRLNNIQESLLFMRTNADMYKRRGGLLYAKDELRFQKWMIQSGYINFFQFIKNSTVRFIMRIIPNNIRGIGYQLIRAMGKS